MKNITLELSNPQFSILHRAGIAGLWMTLNQLNKEGVEAPDNLTWKLFPQKVELFNITPTNLDWLFKEAFQIDQGLISLRGINAKNMRRDAVVIVHQGILGTFLQHNSTLKSAGIATEVLSLDDEGQDQIEVKYKGVESYAYQTFIKNLVDKKDKDKFVTKPINIAGWLNPGVVVKHVSFSADTSFKESFEGALALAFSPVACYYYLLRSRLRDIRAQYALVIPEVKDLEKFAQYKQDIHLRYASYKDFHASGLGDAGMRFLTYETTTELSKLYEIERCKVVTLGTVSWSSQQKTRTDLYLVESNLKVCRNYRVSREHLLDRVLQSKKGENYLMPSFAREFIAENLARGQPWYQDLSMQVNSLELFKTLSYERRGLNQMVNHADWGEAEKLFVKACHQALSRLYAKSYSTLKEGEASKIEKINIQLFSKLNRCKNAETCREIVVDLMSRGAIFSGRGSIPELVQHQDIIFSFVLLPENWKKVRDLVLLSLASYQGKNSSTTNSFNSDELSTESDSEIETVDL
jgi:CRISPR-associated protein Cas8a1/Csx13